MSRRVSGLDCKLSAVYAFGLGRWFAAFPGISEPFHLVINIELELELELLAGG